MTAGDPGRLAAAVDDCRIQLAALRESWGWLVELTAPGREGSVPLPVDDDRAEVLEALAWQTRAYRDWALRHGRTALPPTPAAARVEVVDAQAMVHTIVLAAVRLVARAAGASYVGPAGGVDPVMAALDWLDEGTRPDPWVAAACGLYRQGTLDRVRDAGVAARLAARLAAADRVARRAARVLGEATMALPDRCPACRARSLQLHYDPHDLARMGDAARLAADPRATVVQRTGAWRRVRPRQPAAWWVECVSDRCRCVADGCACRGVGRVAGRRHVWPYGELQALWTALTVAPKGPGMRGGGEGRGWR